MARSRRSEGFSPAELCDKFDVACITKSPTVFDWAKLGWMNGQHLRAMPEGELVAALSGGEGSAGETEAVLAPRAAPAFAALAAALVKGNFDVITEAAPQVCAILDYPLERRASDPEDKAFAAVMAAADSGELAATGARGGAAFKGCAKAVGKDTGRKRKRIFMPLRVALTGARRGPTLASCCARSCGASRGATFARASRLCPSVSALRHCGAGARRTPTSRPRRLRESDLGE
jgi:glutamyl/glutaminyl-tRNA synthetase